MEDVHEFNHVMVLRWLQGLVAKLLHNPNLLNVVVGVFVEARCFVELGAGQICLKLYISDSKVSAWVGWWRQRWRR